MKVKSHFENVVELIAIVRKLETVKNKTRQPELATIDCPTQTAVSR